MIHGLTPLWNDVIDGGDNSEPRDEGMAYAMQEYATMADGRLSVIEASVKEGTGCPKNKNLENNWQEFWCNYGQLGYGTSWPSVVWDRSMLGQLFFGSGSRAMSSSEINNVANTFGVKLSCEKVAAALNAILKKKGCNCITYTCDNLVVGPGYISPKEAIDPLFK